MSKSQTVFNCVPEDASGKIKSTMFSDRELSRPGNFLQPHAPKKNDQDVIESEMELNSFDNRVGDHDRKSFMKHYYCATSSENGFN